MHWFSSLLDTLNYWTIFLGMYIEGTVIPFPSELIVSPAAYHAAAGHLNVFWVVIVATLGAVAGSTTNYVAAYYLGRPICKQQIRASLFTERRQSESCREVFLRPWGYSNPYRATYSWYPTNHLDTCGLVKNDLLEVPALYHHRLWNMELCTRHTRLVPSFCCSRKSAHCKNRRV